MTIENQKPPEEITDTPATGTTAVDPWVNIAQGVYKIETAASSVDNPHGQVPGSEGQVQGPESSAMTLGRFVDSASKLLEAIDKQGTGYITREQLGEAVENPSFTGEQAQVLAAMYANFKELRNLGQHEGRQGSISLADLNQLGARNAAQHQSLDNLDYLNDWSKGHLDKAVSLTDIGAMLQDPNISEHDQKALGFLKEHFTEIAKTNGTVTHQEILTYTTNEYERLMDTSEQELNDSMRAYVELVKEGQSTNFSRDLYGTADPLSSIKPEAIRQGLIGDCYFEASLAAVASTNPEIIRNAIQDNHDGTYTVTFPGATDMPVTVAAPTDTELGLYNHASKFGTWASIMEKAYGELRLTNRDVQVNAFSDQLPFRIPPPAVSSAGGPPQEAADGGANIGPALSLLTGHKHETISYAPENLQNDLKSALSGKPPKAVVAATRTYDDRVIPQRTYANGVTPDGYTSNHAFSVIAFNPDAKGGGEVNLFDPAGIHIVVPMEKFIKNFPWITVEK